MGAGRIHIAAYMPAIDLAGARVGGAQLYFFKDDTEQPEPVFKTVQLDEAHPHPVQANAFGDFPPIFADKSTVYRAVMTSGDGETVNHFKQRVHVRAGPLYPGDRDGKPVSLPFKGTVPANNLVALLGDSITGAGIENHSDSIRDSARGMGFWIPTLTRQAFRTHQTLNFGVAGDATASILTRVDNVLQSGAGTCVVLAGSNDVGLSLDKAQENLATIFKRLTDANILTIAVPILQRSLESQMTRSWRHALNHWIREQEGHLPNFRVIDAAPRFGDPFSPVGAPSQYCTYDGIHPMSLGGRHMSQRIADYLSTLRPARPLQTDCIHDHYEPVHNERGFLNQNPMMLGESGAVYDGFLTGTTVADKWHIARSEGGGDISRLAMSGSKIISPRTGLPAQRIEWSGDVLGGWQTHLGVTDYGLTFQHVLRPGDEIEFIVDLDVQGRLDGVSGIAAMLSAYDGEVWKTVMSGSSSVGDLLTGEGYSGVIRTPALPLSPNFVPGSAVRCDLWVYFHNSLSRDIGGSVDIISASVRKLVDCT